MCFFFYLTLLPSFIFSTQSLSHFRVWFKEEEQPLIYLEKAIAAHEKAFSSLPTGVSKDYLISQFLKILEREEAEEHKEMFVFYHGTLPSRGFIFDLLTLANEVKDEKQKVSLKMRSSVPSLGNFSSVKKIYFHHIFPKYLAAQQVYLKETPQEEIKNFHEELFQADSNFSFKEETWQSLKENHAYIRPGRPLLQRIEIESDCVYGDHFLCANLYLFGNFGLGPGYSLAFYFNQLPLLTKARQQTLQDLDFDSLLKDTLIKIGILENRYEAYKDLFHKYFSLAKFEEGRFYQIFIAKDLVNKICYLSEGNGLLIYLKKEGRLLKTSEILDMLQKDPFSFEKFLQDADGYKHQVFHTPLEGLQPSFPHYHQKSNLPLLNLLQARIWLKEDLFLEGQKKGKIVIYNYHLRQIDENKYYQELKQMLEQDLKVS